MDCRHLRLIRTGGLVLLLGFVGISAALSCPLGDCDGSHITPPVDGANRQYFAGFTGTYAGDVDLTGGPLLANRAVVFVEHRLGRVPIMNGGRAKYGGVPQNGDLHAHLVKMRTDIARQIPDPNWSGYAMIDYESWKPLWDLEWPDGDLYREESRRLVRSRYPGMSAAQVEAKAKEEYEAAAKDFWLATVHEAKRLRPHAKWGVYGFVGFGRNDSEPDSDRLSWLWDEMDVFYPVVYMRNVAENPWTRRSGTWSEASARAYTDRRLDMAVDLAGDRPIVPIVWQLYLRGNPHFGGQLLNDIDFHLAFEYPFEHAAIEGIIVWDSVNSRQKERELESDFGSNGQVGRKMMEIIERGGSASSLTAPERRRADR
jgi:hypothetical protein